MVARHIMFCFFNTMHIIITAPNPPNRPKTTPTITPADEDPSPEVVVVEIVVVDVVVVVEDDVVIMSSSNQGHIILQVFAGGAIYGAT